jgi:putative hydrolase of the HAD superfamily
MAQACLAADAAVEAQPPPRKGHELRCAKLAPALFFIPHSSFSAACKVAALGVAARVRHAYLTNRYGRHRAKPAPHVFELICRREKVVPGQVLYVGDNPRKDFVGIKPLGFRTVRILRGNYAHLEADAAHEADRRIHSLDELSPEFLAELFI